MVDEGVVLGVLLLGVLGQQRAGDLQEAVLLLVEHDSRHLGAKPGRVILGREQRLEALDTLARVEELLMGQDDLVDAIGGEAEVLRDE